MKPAPAIPSRSKRWDYARMTPEEFSTALEQFGIPALEFARLTGKNYDRVRRMLKGEEDIPHDVLILCSLLDLPGGLERATSMTDRVIIYRKEDDS